MLADASTLQLLALDLGGVIVETGPVDAWASRFAQELLTDARRTLPHGTALPAPDRVAFDLTDGKARHSAWKEHAHDGAELDDQQLWQLLAPPSWGPALLDHIAAHRARLTKLLCLRWEFRSVRAGIHALIDFCDSAAIRVCVVSNTISGPAYRDVLREVGLSDRFTSLAFSDEVGVRKPDPRILFHGIARAGATPATTWYVGDTYNRDVACGRRAGVARTILMRSQRTEPDPGHGPIPDIVVADPHELLDRITTALQGHAHI